MNVLSPGQVDIPDSQRLDAGDEDLFQSLLPRGKMGCPERKSRRSLCLLSSDDLRFVLSIDGGFSAI